MRHLGGILAHCVLRPRCCRCDAKVKNYFVSSEKKGMKIRLKTWQVHVWSAMIILANNLAIALTEQMMPKSTLFCCGLLLLKVPFVGHPFRNWTIWCLMFSDEIFWREQQKEELLWDSDDHNTVTVVVLDNHSRWLTIGQGFTNSNLARILYKRKLPTPPSNKKTRDPDTSM